jgi:hypothetical protein
MQFYDLDVRMQYQNPATWILITDSTRPFASLPQQITFRFRPSQPSQFLARIRNNEPIAKRVLYLMPHTIPFPTRLDIFRDMIASERLSAPRRQCLIKVRRQYLMEDGYQSLALQGKLAWQGDIRVSFVNELGKIFHDMAIHAATNFMSKTLLNANIVHRRRGGRHRSRRPI